MLTKMWRLEFFHHYIIYCQYVCIVRPQTSTIITVSLNSIIFLIAHSSRSESLAANIDNSASGSSDALHDDGDYTLIDNANLSHMNYQLILK
jgi:hypothetical protein